MATPFILTLDIIDSYIETTIALVEVFPNSTCQFIWLF